MLKVAEDLLSFAPVHGGRSLLVAAGEELLPRLGSRGAQTQAALNERIRNAPLVLIGNLRHKIGDLSWTAVGFCQGHTTHRPPLTGMLMSELLISDWVVELLEDWDAELPLGLGLGRAAPVVESVTVTLMDGGSAAGSSTVGDGVVASLLAADASAYTSVMEQPETHPVSERAS